MKLDVVILAAGKGSRMNSSLPKVLHRIGGLSMLEHVIAAAQKLDSSRLHIVVGYGGDEIKQYLAASEDAPNLNWASQEPQLGTGHAVQQALPGLDLGSEDNLVLVLYGDVPLIKTSTLQKLLLQTNADTLSLLTVKTENPSGMGRIIRDGADAITAIVEERDASTEQKQIKEINSGIMAIPALKLARWLSELKNNNAQAEYHLTDIVALAAKEKCEINAQLIEDEFETQGVNDKSQLASLERHYQMGKVETLLQAGVAVRDPARVDIRGVLETGKDVEIDVNVIFDGEVTLADNVAIGANTSIKDAAIGEGSKILPGTIIEGAVIGKNTTIGPYARIRPGTILKDNVKIGNFVETKNAIIGKGSKASHLAYIGDAELGENVNIGAGVIVCNYDGVNKHRTRVGNNVFVGSNSVLVAPIELADNAFIAAGSTINVDVPVGDLAVARSKQRNVSGWKRPGKK
jgi:bifunctional UDP-N-acetylglucosamine pyrophosphorylase/glucosamine-1-phosphate N-acetyltransferase